MIAPASAPFSAAPSNGETTFRICGEATDGVEAVAKTQRTHP